MTNPAAGPPSKSYAEIFRAASEGLRFEIVPNFEAEDRPASQPFALLSDGGRYSKVLLARVVSAGGTVLRDVALKVQRDEYASEPIQQVGRRNEDTNPSIARLWRREIESLTKFAQGSTGVVQILDLFDFDQGKGPDSEPSQSKPVLYCRKTRDLFHALCPECTGLLEDCRDEQLIDRVRAHLKDSGSAQPALGPYEGTTKRALYCPRCWAGKTDIKDARLYVRSFPSNRTAKDYGEVLSDRDGLYARLGNAMEKGTIDPRLMPCVKCPERSHCFDPGQGTRRPVSDRIHPLSFYEFYAIPMDCLHLQYDIASQIIGGRDFKEYVSSVQRTVDYSTGQKYLLSRITPARDGQRLTVYDPNTSPEQYCLEVLKLKLSLFRDVCAGLARIHESCRSPHLDLKPENIMVKMARAHQETPALWALEAHIIDLASAKPFFHDEDEEQTFIFEPPKNVNETYTSPVMLDTNNFGMQRKGTLKLRNLIENPDFCIIEATITDTSMDSRHYSERDSVVAYMNKAGPLLEGLRVIYTVKPDHSRVSALDLRSIPVHLSADQIRAVRDLIDKNIVASDFIYWKYKCFHIPCDIYSMGMLLLQSLLETDIVHDGTAGAPAFGQGMSQIKAQVDTLRVRLENEYPNTPSVKESLIKKLKAAENAADMAAPERRRPAWCSKKNLLYRPGEQNWKKAESIPDEIWQEALVIAFKMLTNIQGFSYCTNNSDFDVGNPSTIVNRALMAVDVLVDVIHSRLFGLQAVARSVHEALQDLSEAENLSDDASADQLSKAAKELSEGIAQFCSQQVTMVCGSRDLGDSNMGAEIRKILEQELRKLPSPPERRYLSRLLRDRYPYVGESARQTHSRLTDQLKLLRAKLSRLLSVAGSRSSDPPDDAIEKIVDFCIAMKDCVDKAPKGTDWIEAVYRNPFDELEDPPRPWPLEELLSTWQKGGSRTDLASTAARILGDHHEMPYELVRSFRRAADKFRIRMEKQFREELAAHQLKQEKRGLLGRLGSKGTDIEGLSKQLGGSLFGSEFREWFLEELLNTVLETQNARTGSDETQGRIIRRRATPERPEDTLPEK